MNNQKDIVRRIMYEVGLDTDINNYIYDQDIGLPFKFNNKFVKYSNNSHVKVNNNNEMYFNILNNFKLTTFLFTYYLKKLEVCDNIYFPVFFTIKNDTKDKHAVVVKNQNVEIQSNFYYNLTLAYIEMIFKIKGGNIDLSYIDKKRY